MWYGVVSIKWFHYKFGDTFFRMIGEGVIKVLLIGFIFFEGCSVCGQKLSLLQGKNYRRIFRDELLNSASIRKYPLTFHCRLNIKIIEL